MYCVRLLLLYYNSIKVKFHEEYRLTDCIFKSNSYKTIIAIYQFIKRLATSTINICM